MEYLHDYKRTIERETEKIKKSEIICKENRKLILDYVEDCETNAQRPATIRKKIMHLRVLAENFPKKSFKEMNEKDLHDVVRWLEKKYDSPQTKKTIKAIIKSFWKFMKPTGVFNHYPPEVAWINTNIKPIDVKLPKASQMITADELLKLVDCADGIRNKALIFSLYESTCRIAEFLLLKIRDINITDDSIEFNVNGKTGERCIVLFDSIPLLMQWLNVHPDRDNPDAYLWVNNRTNGELTRLSYQWVRVMLKGTGRKAGINKPLNPQNFRRSGITDLARKPDINQYILSKQTGWVMHTKVASQYISLAKGDVRNAIAKARGRELEEDIEENKLKPIKCPTCKRENTAGSDYCGCGRIINPALAISLADKRQTEINKIKEEMQLTKEAILHLSQNLAPNEKLKDVTAEIVDGKYVLTAKGEYKVKGKLAQTRVDRNFERLAKKAEKMGATVIRNKNGRVVSISGGSNLVKVLNPR